MATGIEILNGPSVGELIDAFKYATDKKRDFSVQFTVVTAYMLNHDGTTRGKNPELRAAKIVGISHEDASGHRFILDAIFEKKLVHGQHHVTKVFFDAKDRKGTVMV